MENEPLIVAVETSGRLGSVAIAAGAKLLGEKQFSGPMKHSAELFPAINTLLEETGNRPTDIEQVHVSIGPGSFTGLRIAATMAKTMHLANSNIKIVAVDTLDVIAENVKDYAMGEQAVKSVGVVLDAKRGQFFVAAYKCSNNKWLKVVDDCLETGAEFMAKIGSGELETPILLLGEGLVYYKDRFAASGVEFADEALWYPKASKVHKLGYQKALRGEYSDALGLEPAYIQRPDLGKKKI